MPDLFEAIDVALEMAEATDGLVDPTVGAAMNLLGYDRDFAAVVAGVDGELPRERAVPGWRSVARRPEPTRRRAHGGHLPRPRRDSQGAGSGPSGGDHLQPTQMWRARLARRRCVRSRPGTRRRVRHRHRRHVHLPCPRRGHRHLIGRARLIGHRRPPLATGITPGPSHRGPGHRVVRGDPVGGRSRWRRRPAYRRTRRPPQRWCSASAPSTGWSTTGSQRDSFGSTGPSCTRGGWPIPQVELAVPELGTR